jgi:polyhydroxybutyrate depolymerase
MSWPARLRAAAAVLGAGAVAAGCGGTGGRGPAAGGRPATTTSTTTAAAATSTTAAAAATATTARGPRGDDQRLSLRVGGERRTFLLHTPPGWRRSRRLPLVIALHMQRPGADGKVMQRLTELDAVADRERFLVAYPDGLDGQWNAILCCNPTDDVGFIRRMIDLLERRFRVDPDRVYATGASNGAAMSYRLAAALPGVLAAIGPVSGAVPDPDVPEGFPRSPVSLVAFHGRQDGVFDALDEGVAAWRRHAGCRPPLRAAHGASGTVTWSIAPCRDGSDVLVYELAEMDHAWPGATGDDPMAAPDAPISASELLWEFFERHTRVISKRGG